MVSAIQPGARVLVTGATGYLGASVAEEFIRSGYIVVGSTRTLPKAENVKNYFNKKYGPGKFEIIESGNIEKQGTFDDVVRDVEAIVHVASPVGVASEDPIKDVIDVAINGTTSLLNSALNHGKNVKSVVMVSSLVSVLDPSVPEEYVYDEKDWNDEAMKSVIELKKKGESVHHFLAYMASKNESERAVWKFKEDKTPSFTLSTVIPSWIYGAIVPTPQTAADVEAASTASYVAQFYTGESQNYNQVFTPVGFVNITDVARAILLIVEKNEISNGQRYILNAGTYSFQEIADILRKNFPERQSIIVKGVPGNYEKANQSKKHNGSKITRDFGLKYSSLETTVVDLANSIRHVYQ